MPRSRHAELNAGPDRPEALTLLRHRDGDRGPELLPIRYGRMAVSPFAFFRGAAGPIAKRPRQMLQTLDARLAQARAGELGHLEFLQVLCLDEISRARALNIAALLMCAAICLPVLVGILAR